MLGLRYRHLFDFNGFRTCEADSFHGFRVLHDNRFIINDLLDAMIIWGEDYNFSYWEHSQCRTLLSSDQHIFIGLPNISFWNLSDWRGRGVGDAHKSYDAFWSFSHHGSTFWFHPAVSWTYYVMERCTFLVWRQCFHSHSRSCSSSPETNWPASLLMMLIIFK